MKTQTAAKILKLIEQRGQARPAELREWLQISAQAVHRHLKGLVERGLLEAKGSAPFTRYALAGVPEFEGLSNWSAAQTLSENPEMWVCETREILAGRLPRLSSFLAQGLPESHLPLVIATAGEIANNSFDHNLGQWRDVPGCWFESQVSGRSLWISIADRGQGVLQSLTKVHPHLQDDQSALIAAFETIISGRAPEKRGNGLKFVRHIILTTPGSGIACMSGNGRVQYGEAGGTCLSLLSKYFARVPGTLTLMTWRLS